MNNEYESVNSTENSRRYVIYIYHVQDGDGVHHLLSVNDYAIKTHKNSVSCFEHELSKQYRTCELLATFPVEAVGWPPEFRICETEAVGCHRVGQVQLEYGIKLMESWSPKENPSERASRVDPKSN